MSDKNLMNFGSITSKFYRRVCARQATRWALPCIYSLLYSAVHTHSFAI